MDSATRSQSHLSASYQGNSITVASSNRQSPTLLGTTLSPSSQSYQPNDETLSQSAGYLPNADQEVSMGQSDTSGRPTIVVFTDALLISCKRI